MRTIAYAVMIAAGIFCLAAGPQIEQARPAAADAAMDFGQWLADLEQARKENNLEKIDQLIRLAKQQNFRPAGRENLPQRQRSAAGRISENQQDAALQKPPSAKNDNDNTILAVLYDILQNQRAMNVPQSDGRLLRLLTEFANVQNVVEIGTSTGYSAVWFAMALQKTGGKLTTFEIDPQRAAAARANFKRAGLAEVIEGDAHETVAALKEPIDILFLDADKDGYIDYLNKLLPLVRAGGLVIAHNITPGMADKRYMEAITANPDLETIVRSGVSLTLKKR
jgi:predicted O-methyltransferase YrrM